MASYCAGQCRPVTPPHPAGQWPALSGGRRCRSAGVSSGHRRWPKAELCKAL